MRALIPCHADVSGAAGSDSAWAVTRGHGPCGNCYHIKQVSPKQAYKRGHRLASGQAGVGVGFRTLGLLSHE
jgi:hypothetical protein